MAKIKRIIIESEEHSNDITVVTEWEGIGRSITYGPDRYDKLLHDILVDIMELINI